MVELSSLDVRVLALELRPLEDAYVDKVHETEPGTFVVKLRHPEHGNAVLLLRPGAFVARADAAPPAPEEPTTVAMTLRKLLAGTRLRRVDQHEFDRVLRLQLERRGEPMEVVVELFGKGNLIVAAGDGTILFTSRTETFAHRTVKRGEKLVFPPSRANPLTLPRSDFERMVGGSEKDTVRFLALDVALGGDLAEEIVHRAGVDKGRKVASLALDELDRLWTALREVLAGTPSPAVAHHVRGWRVECVRFTAPVFRDEEREPMPSLSAAILRLGALEVAEEEAEKPDEEAARLERQIQHQERGVEELGREADLWERRGHLLYAHYALGALVLQKAKATIEALEWSGLADVVKRRSAEDDDAWATHVVSVDAKRARILVRLATEDVPLDPFASVEQNATILYDESKRVRAKQEGARNALAETRTKLADRRRRPTAGPKAAAPKAPAKRFWFESLRWFYSSEGFLVVAGRDAASNEKLVKRHLGAGDRYCHADVQGAASVVVKGEGRSPGEPTMREACQFAAVHSKAFNQFAAADAYWVHPEQVSKTPEAGQFVPKGAFIIRGARNYFPKMDLRLGLGLLRLDVSGKPGGDAAPHPRLTAGPVEAMRAHAKHVVVVERGDQKPTDAARRLAPLFRVTMDEVVAALPAGNVRVAPEAEARA